MSSARNPPFCAGTNCTATPENGFKHSSECIFEHARSVASGVKEVRLGVTLSDSVDYVDWRGRRIELAEPDFSGALAAECQRLRGALERAALAMWRSEANMDNEAADADAALAGSKEGDV